MLGAGLQFRRSRRGEDRFCNPAKSRWSPLNHDHLLGAQSDAVAFQSPHSKRDTSTIEKEAPLKPALALQQVASSPLCNLDRFLESITPSVPAQYLSKTTIRGWKTCDVEFQPYFLLSDLWESFKEWSAYGAGVPLILNDSDSVVQYYVPYLSGIQLYVDSSSNSLVKSRRTGEDSDGDYYRDSSSDGSSDSELERGCLNYLEQWRCNQQKSDFHLRLDQLSLREQHLALQEGFSSDESESGNFQGCLLFEYLEQNPPYNREPLADKISDLAARFPELKTLRSCDLLPCSWISVAWYPIYRIPTGPTLRDLDACFLTFHYLHTSMTGSKTAHAPIVKYSGEMDGIPKISLPVFGLASYKFKLSLWTHDTGSNHQLVNSLQQEADNWLTLLQVNHPDFLFFCRR